MVFGSGNYIGWKESFSYWFICTKRCKGKKIKEIKQRLNQVTYQLVILIEDLNGETNTQINILGKKEGSYLGVSQN